MNVTVPDLGDFSDVEVIEILVKPGDVVGVDDSLITLETEKATMDVPSPAAGKVSEVKVGPGSTVSTGDLIVVLEADDANGSAEAAASTDTADEPGGPGGSAAAAPDDGESAGAAATDAGEAAESGSDEAAKAEPELVAVPELGDFSDVDVIEVLVAVGDEVEAEQGLITLETDKATMDVPSPVAGRVLELRVEAGGTVNAGDAVALIEPSAPAKAAARKPASGKSEEVDNDASGAAAESGAEAEPSGAAAITADRFEQTTTALPAVGIDEAGFSRAHASPSVRKLARELGVDLGRVRGSGRKGRVTADDVKAFVKRILTEGGPGRGWPRTPEVDFAKFGPVEQVRLSRIQKISGPRLVASWVNLPHVTQHDEADITELEEKRQALKEDAAERNLKLTPLAFIIRAVVLTLADFPQFRSSLAPDGENLIVKGYYHLGFAADTPKGLVVPVIRDADRKDIFELAGALGELSARARDGKLGADDLQGGVFTVSSLGGIGGSFFTPIINAPEVAILGVSRSNLKPVYDGKEFKPRLMLPLSLSYDHRVIDGAQAARFITELGKTLGEIDRLTAAIP
ncbi:MAG TPA: dihydrolipoyllysine-residue acetyltransferase [Gammaproteobacteria bacterium]|nr:dihydrolipoyllysine-residue acetyltransferase [Gammaproteobacteria bacterium]